MLFALGGVALSGLCTDPGNHAPCLMGVWRGSRSQIDAPMRSARRLVWSRMMQGASPGGPNRRLSGHLVSKRGPLRLGEGALRCSDPMGPSAPAPFFYPQHKGAGIRMEPRWVQLQDTAVLDESTDKPWARARLGGDAGSCLVGLWLRSGWPGLWYPGPEPGRSRGRAF